MVSLSEHASYQASVEATCRRLLRDGRRRDAPLRKLAQWRAALRRRGAKLLLQQIEAANRMSYRAVEDLVHSGVVRACLAFSCAILCGSMYTSASTRRCPVTQGH